MSEQFPGQARDQDPRSDPGSQYPAGLPSESVGAPRPPRQFRKALRTTVPYAIVFALVGLYFVSPIARALYIVLYALLAWLAFVILMVRRLRRRRARRSRPPSLPR